MLLHPIGTQLFSVTSFLDTSMCSKANPSQVIESPNLCTRGDHVTRACLNEFDIASLNPCDSNSIKSEPESLTVALPHVGSAVVSSEWSTVCGCSTINMVQGNEI